MNESFIELVHQPAGRRSQRVGRAPRQPATRKSARKRALTAPAVKIPAAPVAMTDDYRARLIIEHQRFAENMAWKLLKQWQIRMNRDDVASDASLALCAAARTFDPRRGVAFSTLLFHHVRGVLLKNVTKVMNHQRTMRTVWEASKSTANAEQSAVLQHGADTSSPEDLHVRRERRVLYSSALQMLAPAERMVIEKWIFEDKSLVDVAEELGYSRGHVSRLKAVALSKLADLIPQPAA